MANFLFWNIARKPLSDSLARLAARHALDVLMLAECSLTPRQVLAALNRGGGAWTFAAPFVAAVDAKVMVFVRFESKFTVEQLGAARWTIREIRRPQLPSLTLVVVHLPSKWNADDQSQAFGCAELAQAIRAAETRVGHTRTLVVGDFNMNPFESGMLAANGLHAEASRRVALTGSRVVEGERYPFFYNPMWNFWGDETRGPGGTYFYRNSNRVRLSWNIFDQVLLRPALLPFFEVSQLEILSGDGERSFLTRSGTPTTRDGSDHLPITFRLNF